MILMSRTTVGRLLNRAEDILRFASAATPQFDHGWARGVLDRDNDHVGSYTGEFGKGYERGWDEMDKLLDGKEKT
jgi:hypothetical protein